MRPDARAWSFTNMITVVFVVSRGTRGGPNESLLTLLEVLQGKVERILAAPAPLLTVAQDRGAVERGFSLGRKPIPGRIGRILAAGRLMVWLMRHRRSVDLIHANNVSGLNIAGPAALLSGTPLVAWSHASRLSKASIRVAQTWDRVLKRVRWVAVSASAARLLGESGLAADGSITVIPNPISRSKLTERQPAGRFSVTYLGGPAPYKGYPVVANVVRQLREADIDWLVVAGDRADPSADRDHVTALLRSLEGSNLRITGWLADAREAYATADVVFCPSYRESFGLVAAEAMANGIPVVASDIPAFRELIGDDAAGLLFPAGDVEAAADAIKRLADDAGLRQRLGEEGRRRAGRYGEESLAEAVLALYREQRPGSTQV